MSGEAKTILGQDLREIRQSIIASVTPLLDWADLDVVTGAEANKMRAEAVAGERERNAGVLTEVIGRLDCCGPDVRARQRLLECRKTILSVEPPAPEPMTVKKLIDRLTESQGAIKNWRAVEIDLQELIKAQARRDAEVCCSTGCSDCGKLILKAAGLE